VIYYTFYAFYIERSTCRYVSVDSRAVKRVALFFLVLSLAIGAYGLSRAQVCWDLAAYAASESALRRIWQEASSDELLKERMERVLAPWNERRKALAGMSARSLGRLSWASEALDNVRNELQRVEDSVGFAFAPTMDVGCPSGGNDDALTQHFEASARIVLDQLRPLVPRWHLELGEDAKAVCQSRANLAKYREILHHYRDPKRRKRPSGLEKQVSELEQSVKINEERFEKKWGPVRFSSLLCR
jgi:hypothetical protein